MYSAILRACSDPSLFAMISINRYLPAATALVCVVTIAGCGSTPAKVTGTEPDIEGNYYIGTGAVYAHLQQGSGDSWVLGTVTGSDTPPDDGYLLRLNDLAPSFDIRVAECEPQAYPANHKCNPAQPFREKQIGVMGKIISGSIAAGTAGKVTDLSRTYKTMFDDAVFNQAVDEALINTGLGSMRREFLHALAHYETLLEEARAELDASQEKALARYHDTGNLILDIRPKITGLASYYSDDIDFRDIVLIEPLSSGTKESALTNHGSILPCDARQCASKAKAAIGDLDSAIEKEKQNLNSSLAEETSAYALHCDETSYAGYSFVLECPDTLSNTDTGTEIVPVTIDILSRDFDAVYPEIRISDDNLSVSIDGDRVRFRNRTDAYLSISAQTVYYNSQVQTQSKPIDIAPGVIVDRPIDEFVTPAIRIEASYRQMTPDKARRTSLQFGFAAKYLLAGATEETTLYDFRKFSVGCIIDNRMQPSSCRHSTAVKVSEPEDTEQQTADIVGPNNY